MDECLGNANTGEPQLQGKSNNLVPVSAGCASNVTANTPSVFTSCMPFAGFYWVRGMPVSASDNHGFAIHRSQRLQKFHKLGLHFVQPSVLAVELRLFEIRVIFPIHFLGLLVSISERKAFARALPRC